MCYSPRIHVLLTADLYGGLLVTEMTLVTKLQMFFYTEIDNKRGDNQQWTDSELWLLPTKHTLILGIICVHFYEYNIMCNKLTERKNFFFSLNDHKGDIIHQRTVRGMVRARKRQSTIGYHVCAST